MHAEHADGDRMNGLSRLLIGRVFNANNTLGTGCLAKVYEYTLTYEPRRSLRRQEILSVVHHGALPGRGDR